MDDEDFDYDSSFGDGERPRRRDLGQGCASPGDWDEIRFENTPVGPNNQLTYVDIEYGGGSYYGQVWLQNGAEATL